MRCRANSGISPTIGVVILI
ncbi:hypothetical protein GQR42_23435 [Microcystis aeruginosa FD4]|uniref:Uncharacterized protein n=5 Tax=Microcystis TaxID=1125 RepID=A0A857DBF2_MICAE|nr:hypothetical protein GQR42_23435 [Microcystis aeruginosa FD4]TRT77045.1 MAG: hypothetical protein EWV64_10035 [Microcystis flos-aquae Ma_QC_C_20070823_S18]TRT95625.1 MAG: hypothetical protein EWV61_22010 [Microcystis aeruginosa Ma_AC_P_19900807_S300]TRT97790.1 MAG: hypothetical protein EWV65_11135 [Microcystis flos-aquae Ma_QC_C_20070823_S18D]TRU22017.1 MAG: hypothetical protein EWV79_14865 [Microcystis aeruginosa Ma_MB_S_20031200_S102D]TRU30621.1 MAG: hypothetical protein EWV92_21795 [Micr